MASVSAAVGAIILLALCWQDIRHRRLPNRLVALHALAFLPYAYAAGLTWPELGGHIGVALVTFAITLLFFSLGWLGGGDVKLWSSVMLWAGPGLALPALVLGTLSGAVLGIMCWVCQKLVPGIEHPTLRRPLRLLSAERGVPYGIALAAAGLMVLWLRH